MMTISRAPLLTQAQKLQQRKKALATRQAQIAAMREPTWEERMNDPTSSAPYGVRWGKTPKGSNIHIMRFNKYANRFREVCSKTNSAKVVFTNVYLKAKVCFSCTKWLRGVEHRAYIADWAHYTDPATGRTKRERHN